MRFLAGLMDGVTVDLRRGRVALATLSCAFAALLIPAEVAAQSGAAGAAGSNGFESAPTFRADRILSPQILQGPSYRVMDDVAVDGYLYEFDLWTQYDRYYPKTETMLRIRIAETAALDALMKIQQEPNFIKGITGTVGSTVKATGRAIVRPVQTIRNVPIGMEKFVTSTKARNVEGRVEGETGKLSNLPTKRKLAFELGVDPYTDNVELQEALNNVAAHQASGAIVTRIGTMFIPGGVGIGIRVASLNRNLQNRLRDLSGAEIQAQDRKTLTSLGVDRAAIDIFFSKNGYSVTRQMAIVDEMATLRDVRGIGDFLRVLRPVTDPEVPMYHQQQIQMAAGYHTHVGALAQLNVVGGSPVFTGRDGNRHVFAPVDYLYWDRALAQRVQAVTGGRRAQVPTNLYILGTASSAAKSNLEALNVKVHERSLDRFVKGE